MSTLVRNFAGLKAQASLDNDNLLRLDLLKLRNGLIFHADATTAIDLDDAVYDGYQDGYETTAIDLINACSTAYGVHLASDCDSVTGLGCHISVDSTNVLTAPIATDPASAETLANQYKAKFNLHIASAVFHPVADTLNTITADDATDETTLVTLVNECKAKTNSHFAAAFTSQALVIEAP